MEHYGITGPPILKWKEDFLSNRTHHDLQWANRTSNTIGKATRSLGFLRRNLGHCKPSVKANAYCTLIRLSLEYASSVWDPHQTTLIKDLEQVQHRAARFVHNEYRDTSPGCVTTLLNNLGWESLEHRRMKHRLTLCYKIQNQLVDINPVNHLTPGDSRTRGGHRYRQPRASRDVYKFSFYQRTVRDWNHLPESVTAAPTLEEFRTLLDSLSCTQLQHH
ncbi:hypothetical protein FSP39_003548 [Pinctada imbricata]|uniref:Uncharacterized protein n=1 Tax=Pinctada imbricata TaxID=66713 RepID=A0AA89C9T5_PINIB|nr:hypothetical protein FSP39_003548 [Pinctada imbricata]